MTRGRSEPQAGAKAAAVRQLQVDERSAEQRLDNFLLRELKGAPRSLIYRIVRSGEVRINGKRAAVDQRLALGDRVRIPPLTLEPAAPQAAPARAFAPVYEDEQLLALDKPAGVAVHGGSGVSFGVIESLRAARPQARFLELVHRLDRETSGLLLVAKKRSALVALQAQFRERRLDKRYLLLVFGAPDFERRSVDASLVETRDAQGQKQVRVAGGEAAQSALTDFSVRKRFAATPFGPLALLEARIRTGRTHQIRVHARHLGLPIVGDARYGDFDANKALARATGFKRMFLHASLLRLSHPSDAARPLRLVSPLPQDCGRLLERLQAAQPRG